MLKEISTDSAPAAIGPYAQAVRADNFVFLSGQIALQPDGTLLEGDVSAQTRQVMQNLEAVLQAAGLTLGNLVKTTIFLANIDDFAQVNEVYASFLGEHRPARATVAVAGLPKGVDVEIEAVAFAG